MTGPHLDPQLRLHELHKASRGASDRSSGRVERHPATTPANATFPVQSGRDRVTQRYASRASTRHGEPVRRRTTDIADLVTDRDWHILEDVARFRLLTGRQLQLIHFGPTVPTTTASTTESVIGTSPHAAPDANSARAARRCLKRLHDWKVLTRLKRRVGGIRAGSDGYIYALATAGSQLLAQHHGQPASGRRQVREVADGFLQHTLEVAEVYVRLQIAARLGGLTLKHIQAEPTCWRRLESAGNLETDWLKPDLLAVVTTAANEFHSFVEVDRGTEHRPALLRKLRAYELAYRLGVVAVDKTVFPRVVWLVPDPDRARTLAKLISGSSQLTADLHAISLPEQAVHALTGGSLHITPVGGPQGGRPAPGPGGDGQTGGQA